MTRALSVDLRQRAIAAVEEGASCRQAATRFGASASSAIRWRSLSRLVGEARPKQQGGDRRPGRIEAHAATILAAPGRKSDIALADPRDALAGHGIGVGVAGLRRFLKRRKVTPKKRPGMRPSRIAPTF